MQLKFSVLQYIAS